MPVEPQWIEAIKAAPGYRRKHIGPRMDPFVGNVLRADELVFERGGVLRLGRPTDPFVALVARRMIFQVGDSECRLIVPTPAVHKFDKPARPGKDGDEKPARDADGDPGSPGENGEDAMSQPTLLILCESVEFGSEPTMERPPLVIFSRGSDGGDGQEGGRGGSGRDGNDYFRGLVEFSDYR